LAEFKNPNQQAGGDNKSLLVMMLVMVTVFFGLQYFRSKHNPQTALPNASSNPAQIAPPQTGAPSTAPATGSSAATSLPTVAAAAESTTTVENELYRITFSNRGGQVASWILKNYKDTDGKPLDLVHQEAAQKFGYPLSLYTYDAALTSTLTRALYVPSSTGLLAAPATLTFNYSDGATQVRKTFSFDETYVLHADVQVTRNGTPVRALLNWPGGFGDQDNAVAYSGAKIDVSRNTKEQHIDPKKVSGGETLDRQPDPHERSPPTGKTRRRLTRHSRRSRRPRRSSRPSGPIRSPGRCPRSRTAPEATVAGAIRSRTPGTTCRSRTRPRTRSTRRTERARPR
jgi:YidC/Oxa1 family membrane protein insertase